MSLGETNKIWKSLGKRSILRKVHPFPVMSDSGILSGNFEKYHKNVVIL